MSDSAERIELEVKPEFFDALVRLSEEDNRPISEVVRRAIGLYASACIEAKKGRLMAFAALGSNNTMEIKSLVRL